MLFSRLLDKSKGYRFFVLLVVLKLFNQLMLNSLRILNSLGVLSLEIVFEEEQIASVLIVLGRKDDAPINIYTVESQTCYRR